MEPSAFSILYQDTEAAPWDAGASGSQTTFNNGRAVVAAAAEVRDRLLDLAAEKLEVGRDDLELADGHVRVAGAPAKAVSIAELAGTGVALIGKGSGPVPENPPCSPEGCLGRLGFESFLEPQVFTHAARVKVDRETGVVRVLQVAAAHDSGVIVNRIGASGAGLRRGRDGNRPGAPRDDPARSGSGASAIRICSTTSSSLPPMLRASTSTGSRRPPRTAARMARRASASRQRVPTPGAIANAVARVLGARVRALPMTPERAVGSHSRARGMTAAFVSAGSVDEALEALRTGARPVAGGTDLVVGARQGKAPLPERIVAIHRIEELRGVSSSGGGLRIGALATHSEVAAGQLVRERLTALADASSIVGSHATSAQGTVGGNLMNASPAMESGGPASGLRRRGASSLARRRALASRRGPRDGARRHRRATRRAPDRDTRLASTGSEPEAATPASSIGGRWRLRSWA